MSYAKDRESFIDKCSRAGISLQHARQLMRYATTMQRYAELNCCIEMTPAMERADERNDRRVTGLLQILGLAEVDKHEMNGDPRGAVLKIALPGIPGDSWGDRKMTCVPSKGYSAATIERLCRRGA